MRQGEIWEINLSPTVGAEIKKKIGSVSSKVLEEIKTAIKAVIDAD